MKDKPTWQLIQGDALSVLPTFAPNTFDAVVTDPPYASGGRTQAEKNKSTTAKYSSMGKNAPPPFDGDAKDQRSWTRWAAEWLYEARKVCKPGAPVCMFIDWRQLPAATDALQWAGWIWRGTAVWDSVVASSISFASGGRPKAHSFRCSSFPNRTRFAGLRFGSETSNRGKAQQSGFDSERRSKGAA